MDELVVQSGGIQCTAGAIPIKNEKGQISMQKVKVQIYMPGKRPEFASDSESDTEADHVENTESLIDTHLHFDGLVTGISDGTLVTPAPKSIKPTDAELNDPRYKRIMKIKKMQVSDVDTDEEEDRVMKHKRYRHIGEGEHSDGSDSADEKEPNQEIDDDEMARRRELIRQRALQARLRKEDEELAAGIELGGGVEGADEEDRDDDYSEYSDEEYTSSEEEIAPKLKPVFVRKQDRITLQAKLRAEQIAKEAEEEAKRLADERRRDTLKLLESEIRREAEEARQLEDELDALDSDEGHGDANKEQEEYERWKVRELKRIRRDREAREAIQQEKEEIERIRSMTEEERREEFRKNPKLITNVAPKGKYKFLQKYFHRGAFFVSTDTDKVYQRDFSEPTLEDHFDKTKLPAVMQVKNFGRAGQTKYTHLVDQDTTVFDAAWTISNPQALKFQVAHGGGFKPVFEKPTARKNKG